MTLQQLKYIIAIDQYRHFGKAAEACDLNQSTLSLMVKKLEEELDVRIFDRDAHPVAATEIGRKIIDQAKVVLYNAAQIAEFTRNEKESVAGTLRVALISTVAPVLIPGLFKYIHAHYPSISLLTEEMLTGTVKEKLLKAEVDIGILTEPVGDPDLLEIPLFTERFFAYVSENDPDWGLERISAERIRQRPIWIMRNGMQLLDMSAVSSEEDRTYEHYFEGGRVGILLQIVNESGGMTIIPETHVALIPSVFHRSLRPIVDSTISRTIVLAIRRDYIREAMLNAVIRAVKSIIPVTLQDSFIRQRDFLQL